MTFIPHPPPKKIDGLFFKFVCPLRRHILRTVYDIHSYGFFFYLPSDHGGGGARSGLWSRAGGVFFFYAYFAVRLQSPIQTPAQWNDDECFFYILLFVVVVAPPKNKQLIIFSDRAGGGGLSCMLAALYASSPPYKTSNSSSGMSLLFTAAAVVVAPPKSQLFSLARTNVSWLDIPLEK